MNIDVPRQYALLEVNALALLTLRGIESRAARHDERENTLVIPWRSFFFFLFLRRVKHVAETYPRVRFFFTFYTFISSR